MELSFKNFRKGNKFYWYTLTGGTDNGEFSRKTLVNGIEPAGAAGGPADYKTIAPDSSSAATGVRVFVPAKAAVFMVIEKQ